MKYKKYLTIVFIIVTNIVLAQDTIPKPKKEPHPLVAEITRRNELSFNIAPAIGFLTTTTVTHFNTSLGYSRNFGRNHYLRTGIRALFLPTGNYINENSFFNTFKYQTATSDSLLNFTDTVNVSKGFDNNTRASIYIGYEHLFGKRRTRFILGLDANIGITYSNYAIYTKRYSTIYSLDTLTNQYNLTSSFIGENDDIGNTINFHLGFTTRIGIRYEISKRVALNALLVPTFYYEFNYRNVGNTFNLFLPQFVGEVGLIIKL